MKEPVPTALGGLLCGPLLPSGPHGLCTLPLGMCQQAKGLDLGEGPAGGPPARPGLWPPCTGTAWPVGSSPGTGSLAFPSEGGLLVACSQEWLQGCA